MISKCCHKPSNKVFNVLSVDGSTVTVVTMFVNTSDGNKEPMTETYPLTDVVFLRDTPARDRDGEKIVEGDVLNYGDGLVCTGVVEWDSNTGGFVAKETVDGHYTGKVYGFTEAIPSNVHKVGSKYGEKYV